jgi:hypothetical protein
VTASEVYCGWTATSHAAWITGVTAGGTGSGTVGYTVAANPLHTSRIGTVTIGGQTFTVTQAGLACTFTIAPTLRVFDDPGGPGSVAVTAAAGCGWTAVSQASWLHVTAGASGDGDGAVGYLVDANTTTSPREGTVAIAGHVFTVRQAARSCTYALMPGTKLLPAAGGSGLVTIRTQGTCPWAAESTVDWIAITAPAGTGRGTLGYTVLPNPSSLKRFGTVTIAGRTFTVAQTGQVCGFTLDPASASVGLTGGAGRVTVTATVNDCAWTARTRAGWLHVTAGASGTGNGTVDYSVDPKTGAARRTGTITIAGKPFRITQGP